MPSISHVDYLKKAIRALVGSVVESDCLGCSLPDYRLCLSCTQKIPRARQRCIGCQKTNANGMTCWECSEEWHLHRVLTATSYRHSLVKRAVKVLKYQYNRSLVRPLALRLLTALHNAQLPNNPLFVPVPLHKQRERWRGFNQAAYLAQEASDMTLMGYADALKRVKNTSPQTKTLGRAERINSMDDAFVVDDLAVIKGRHIMLVDDVCTTGATLNACARELLKSGASSVTGLVIARV